MAKIDDFLTILAKIGEKIVFFDDFWQNFSRATNKSKLKKKQKMSKHSKSPVNCKNLTTFLNFYFTF